MTTVARRDPADKAKIDAIEEKLLANPEIAKLIDELGTSTTDANDLVRCTPCGKGKARCLPTGNRTQTR